MKVITTLNQFYYGTETIPRENQFEQTTKKTTDFQQDVIEYSVIPKF